MPPAALYTEPFAQFPDRSAHDARWLALAQAIAAERPNITDEPALIAPPSQPGELTIIGSGIESVGFTSSDELLLHEADQVFFCVADPATIVWIKAQRPDAYDLYVLYDDSKLRYLTYMQMAEAMLYFVRKGQKVVAIYYGHPGIFVLSTHRAIQIARREGHQAVMRAGISALDTLCADLGVDPSQPGMQTFEATDMLIRQRRPDPTLHVVLWQVGLIGELGYRRRGYLNSGFTLLLDYLEANYGPDQTVINYIGSRYPGISPMMDSHTIRSLRDPAIQATVTGISTFYIPPSISAPADQAMLENLGLLKPGQTTAGSSTPLRQIDRYGRRELQAFDHFAQFRVPKGYAWQEDTPGARFILALREDGKLRRLYTQNPVAAVNQWAATGLSTRTRTLLARRESGSLQIAAKGGRTKVAPDAQRLLQALLTRKGDARNLLRMLRRAEPVERGPALANWSAARGYAVDWRTLPEDFDLLLHQALYPWVGFYLAPKQQLSLFVFARPGTTTGYRIYLNGQHLNNVRFEQGRLLWRSEDGNATSGQLHADLLPQGVRCLVGVIWPAEQRVAAEHRMTLREHRLQTGTPRTALIGRYQATTNAGQPVMVVVRSAIEEGSRLQIEVDGQPRTSEVSITATGFVIDEIQVAFAAKVPTTGVPPHLQGRYTVRIGNDHRAQLAQLTLSTDHMSLNGDGVNSVSYQGHTCSWQDSNALLSHAKVTLLIDPITLQPMLFGTGTLRTSKQRVALVGMRAVTSDLLPMLLAQPDFSLPAWAWQHLITISAEASHKGGLFVWHGWEKALLNLRIVRTLLHEVAP